MTIVSTKTIGKPVSRVDGPAKVTGAAKYAAEFNAPKLLSVAVSLHGLCRRSEITPDLFHTSSEAYQKAQGRDDALTAAMDRINKRFGADTVQLGIVPPTQAGYVGTKISYTRIPDLAEFNE